VQGIGVQNLGLKGTKVVDVPEPVHASHATSLFPAKRPIAAALGVRK
jgi:hypothetical protein